MSSPQRIVILGPSGSGKSTLARAIGAKLGLPVVHLDALFWLPGWTECETEEFRRRVTEAHKGERWVSEGNYSSKTWDIRLPRADVILKLHRDRVTCLRRAITRSLTQLGRTRADLGPDCPEKLDPAFWKFIWEYDSRQPRVDAFRKTFGVEDRLIELNSAAAIARYLDSLSPPQSAAA